METTGIVHKMNYVLPEVPRGFCAWIGPSPSDTTFFFVRLAEDEPASVRDVKIGMMSALATALAARLGVVVEHDEDSGEVRWIYLIGGEGYCGP